MQMSAIELSIRFLNFCLEHAFPLLILSNILLKVIHFPLKLLLTLRVDSLAIFDQPLKLADVVLENLIFLVEVAIVEGELIQFLAVKATLVGHLLPLLQNVLVQFFKLFLFSFQSFFINRIFFSHSFVFSNHLTISPYCFTFLLQLRLQFILFILQTLILFPHTYLFIQPFSAFLFIASTLLLKLINPTLLLQILHLYQLQLFIPVCSITNFLFSRQRCIIKLLHLIVSRIKRDVFADWIVTGLSILRHHVFVLEVNSLVDILGQAEDLIVWVNDIFVLDEMFECINIWRAIEKNGSSIRFEGTIHFPFASRLPTIFHLDQFLLLRPQPNISFLALDQSFEISLDTGKLSLHVDVK